MAITFDYFTDFLHMDIVVCWSTYFNTGKNFDSNKKKIVQLLNEFNMQFFNWTKIRPFTSFYIMWT
jgi:hypothetical protein